MTNLTISNPDDNMPAANTGFASGGVTCKLGALCFYSSSVQVGQFCPPKPARTQSPKTVDELIRKAEGYLAAGVGAAWVVVPSAQTIFVLKPNAKIEPYAKGIIRDDATGIEVNVEEVFR